MASDPLVTLLNGFLKASGHCLDALLDELALCTKDCVEGVAFSAMRKGKKSKISYSGDHFFLRTSTEYSSPQLTLEETQGILAARLLEVCGNYLENKKDRSLRQEDLLAISESLRKPPSGKIIPFILLTDEIEPDRYSNNPFRASIVDSGQSAFPVATVKTPSLKIDTNFVAKYEGSLISGDEVDFIKHHLHDTKSYMDLVDFVKCDALERLSELLGIDLCLPFIRMPLEVLTTEKKGNSLHRIIQESHRDRDSVELFYQLMGRSIKKKRTLLTVPHSKKGFGSKRSAKGRLVFNGNVLDRVEVTYETVKLYPNMADPDDISVAKANDSICIEAEDLANYDYTKTPSSPQFALFIVLSPENASLSHGVGEYAGTEITKSYCCINEAYIRKLVLEDVSRPNICDRAPLVLNLVPEKMWLHPKHGNLDASIGCIDNPSSLLGMEMAVEHLDFTQEVFSRLPKKA